MKMWMDGEIILVISLAGERLGFQLRPRQQEVVLVFVKGGDVFVSLPTGVITCWRKRKASLLD